VKKARGERGHEILAQPEGWKEDQEEEAFYQAAEEIRLLYVAATRAENMLVVSKYEGNSVAGPWHRLYPYLAFLPELPACEQTVRMDTNAAVDWREVRASLERRRAAAAIPSYSVRPISGNRADEDLEYVAREGRGRTYGVVIHQLFEDAVRGRIPAAEAEYVRQLVLEAGLDESVAGDALQALGRFKTSLLWQEVSEADRLYTEVPLASPGEDGIVRGIIDLVYQHAGKWKIVDYKTDAAATQAEAERLLRHYEPQIHSYEAFWEEITGEQVESTSIWFVHGPARENQLALF
jgi:ATP-dependent helicase/nuclease subunit A